MQDGEALHIGLQVHTSESVEPHDLAVAAVKPLLGLRANFRTPENRGVAARLDY